MTNFMFCYHKLNMIANMDLALHSLVNKYDKMSFYSCVQYNLEETHGSTPYYVFKFL